MHTLLAQIAPQRSTQYAALASALAPHELRLCPLGQHIREIKPTTLAGQDFLQFELPNEPTLEQAKELGMLAMISSFFLYYDRLGEIQGPLLRPIETHFEPALPRELVVARRYRGKTNELFTHFLCNVARFSSPLAHRPWSSLRVLDPLAGGGTTLFAALVLGASVAGIEHNATVAGSTAAFLKQFAKEQGIACDEKRARLKGVGQRWTFRLGRAGDQLCVLARGDTADAATLISGFRPHYIIADLPYGVQHRSELTDLLDRALPVWASLLPRSGVMVLSWESRRLPRSELIELAQTGGRLVVLNHPPYNHLAHRVDRVIKQRDVLVARPTEGMEMASAPLDPGEPSGES